MQPRSLLPLLFPATLAISACEEAAPKGGPQPLADAAKGSESIADRHFGRVTVPCDDQRATARALLELTRRDLGEGARTRLLDYGTDRVRLKDGYGRIAVIVYSISNENGQATGTTTEHFLINDSCRVMHWSSAVDPAD